MAGFAQRLLGGLACTVAVVQSKNTTEAVAAAGFQVEAEFVTAVSIPSNVPMPASVPEMAQKLVTALSIPNGTAITGRWALPTPTSLEIRAIGPSFVVATAAGNSSEPVPSLRGRMPTLSLVASLQGALDRHNLYRARHNALPLIWDSSLEASARDYANRCMCHPLQHSGFHGENLGVGHSSEEDAVDAWYRENSKYDYYASDDWYQQNFHDWGHFTQVVWKGTDRLGCWTSQCNCPPYGSNNFVCHYLPSGNVLGAFRANVEPPSNGNQGGQPHGDGGCTVELYADCNFGGLMASVTCSSTPCKADFTWLTQNTNWRNDALSSVKVSSGCRVNLKEHGDCGGSGWGFTGDVSCLVQYNFNDMMSCMTIERV